MEQNTRLRAGVLAHLATTLPNDAFVTMLDDWQVIDGSDETPALMVYLDDGELDTQYMDGDERYSGVLMVSIYLGAGSTDPQLDEKGEQVKRALPVGIHLNGIATLYRSNFQYERSESGSYRALHFAHTYRLE